MNLSGLLGALGNQIGGAQEIRRQNLPIEAALIQSGFDVKPEQRAQGGLQQLTQAMLGNTSSPTSRAVMSNRHPAVIAQKNREQDERLANARMRQDRAIANRNALFKEEELRMQAERDAQSIAEKNRDYDLRREELNYSREQDKQRNTKELLKELLDYNARIYEINQKMLEGLPDIDDYIKIQDQIRLLEEEFKTTMEDGAWFDLFDTPYETYEDARSDSLFFGDPELAAAGKTILDQIAMLKESARSYGARAYPYRSASEPKPRADADIDDTLDKLSQAAGQPTSTESNSGLPEGSTLHRMNHMIPSGRDPLKELMNMLPKAMTQSGGMFDQLMNPRRLGESAQEHKARMGQ